jgi:hypothetical protein
VSASEQGAISFRNPRPGNHSICSCSNLIWRLAVWASVAEGSSSPTSRRGSVWASTRRIVNETFAEEKPYLKPLPLAPFRALLRL